MGGEVESIASAESPIFDVRDAMEVNASQCGVIAVFGFLMFFSGTINGGP